MAFYSRWHSENVRLPELKAALTVVTDPKQTDSLEHGIEGWESALKGGMTMAHSNNPAIDDIKTAALLSKKERPAFKLLDVNSKGGKDVELQIS
jgi:hypothetical protein